MKNLFAVIFALCTMLSVALPGQAGPGRPSFSARSSYSGGFRSSSSPSYRSFSSPPSRNFTYKASTPSYSAPTRPTYSYTAPVAARPISRSTVKSTTVNHYHGDAGHSSGGGLSLMDYAVLQSLNSHDHGPTYVNTQPAVVGAQPVAVSAPMGSYDAPGVIYQAEESHFWRNFFLFVFALFIIAAIVAAGVHFHSLEEDD